VGNSYPEKKSLQLEELLVFEFMWNVPLKD